MIIIGTHYTKSFLTIVINISNLYTKQVQAIMLKYN